MSTHLKCPLSNQIILIMTEYLIAVGDHKNVQATRKYQFPKLYRFNVDT